MFTKFKFHGFAPAAGATNFGYWRFSIANANNPIVGDARNPIGVDLWQAHYSRVRVNKVVVDFIMAPPATVALQAVPYQIVTYVTVAGNIMTTPEQVFAQTGRRIHYCNATGSGATRWSEVFYPRKELGVSKIQYQDVLYANVLTNGLNTPNGFPVTLFVYVFSVSGLLLSIQDFSFSYNFTFYVDLFDTDDVVEDV